MFCELKKQRYFSHFCMKCSVFIWLIIKSLALFQNFNEKTKLFHIFLLNNGVKLFHRKTQHSRVLNKAFTLENIKIENAVVLEKWAYIVFYRFYNYLLDICNWILYFTWKTNIISTMNYTQWICYVIIIISIKNYKKRLLLKRLRSSKSCVFCSISFIHII